MEIVENQESLTSQAEKEFKDLAKQIDLTRIYKSGHDEYLYMIEVFHIENSSISKFLMLDRYGNVDTYNDYQIKAANINPIPQFLKFLSKGIK